MTGNSRHMHHLFPDNLAATDPLSSGLSDQCRKCANGIPGHVAVVLGKWTA